MPFLSAANSAAGEFAMSIVPETGPCNMLPTRDLIEWIREPGRLDSAQRIGDVDLAQCKPTLDTWRDEEYTGPGYCYKIAWASDNPGYDEFARPAPPLKKVIDQVGDC